MNVEQEVAAHYSPGMLEEKILSALGAAGKNVDHLTAEDLSKLDEFHVGAREATEALAEFMHLRPGMHLLDVGCGIGGPARYFAERGCKVTGIDLSEEFIRTAKNLTRMVKLDRNTTFRQASALELPFDARTFDGAYEIHAGMNIPDKAGVFREVARVLKSGARFAIFDIMHGSGAFEFPVPWAQTRETNFAASLGEYRSDLEAAGFRIEHERNRTQFAIDFMQRMAAEKPVLGVHVLMGEQAPLMLKNVMTAIGSGALQPFEIIAVAN